jgi:hypothetical protein
LEQAIAFAAQQNYRDNLKFEGIAFNNSSFYTTFKALAVTADENGLWKIALPQMPVGVGAVEGVSTVKFKSSIGELSFPVVMMSANQNSFHRGMREIPNKLLAFVEGQNVFVYSSIILSQYTSSVTMISGGLSTNLASTLNVPSDYLPLMNDYLTKYFLMSRNVPVDEKPDGIDSINNV